MREKGAQCPGAVGGEARGPHRVWCPASSGETNPEADADRRGRFQDELQCVNDVGKRRLKNEREHDDHETRDATDPEIVMF